MLKPSCTHLCPSLFSSNDSEPKSWHLTYESNLQDREWFTWKHMLLLTAHPLGVSWLWVEERKISTSKYYLVSRNHLHANPCMQTKVTHHCCQESFLPEVWILLGSPCWGNSTRNILYKLWLSENPNACLDKYTLLHKLACNIASYCTSGRGIFMSHS